MMEEPHIKRYLELQSEIVKAREKKSIAREIKDKELLLDAESSLDFLHGAQSELVRWFGRFPSPL